MKIFPRIIDVNNGKVTTAAAGGFLEDFTNFALLYVPFTDVTPCLIFIYLTFKYASV